MAALDHVVINALRDTDAAEALFSALGFQLTPRGYHTLGSVNHLMMTPGAYLEIIGVPPEGRQRQEVLDSPRGLNGIVLKISDADETFARLVAAGFDPLPPMDFSRPVTVGDEEHVASFRTVRLKPDFFGGGRVYFCHHLTPDLVWRPEWLDHPNGFRAIECIEIESDDPTATAERFALAFEGRVEAGAVPARVVLDDCEILVHAGQRERMRATRLRFGSLDGIIARAEAAGIAAAETSPGCVTLNLPGLDTTLECRSDT
ncbi:VOC family protein [Roseibacterium sp. SDUM158016]|jgi:hypothetical protein|uniref:VOC family protein n=1 Tax=Roseicyclus sediminis TaxID=2980997 RepID=UPI0021D13C2C|nr:VOC family protein [Roseibacterium sp. SDUM158016]MCU4652044.1 VOC family protein [Roseibacterium sp. SDUM158016]